MKLFITLFLFCSLILKAQAPFSFSVSGSGQFSITCYSLQVIMQASSNYTNPIVYTWTGPAFSATGVSVSVSNPGAYTVSATSGTTTITQTLSIGSNTVAPVITISPTLVILNNNGFSTATCTAISPTINLLHSTYSPGMDVPVQGGGKYGLIMMNNPGTYTHCVTNTANGCVTCSIVVATFTVTGLTEYDDKEDIVFSNPNNGFFKLTIPSSNKVLLLEIYNTLGVSIKRIRAVSPDVFIDIQSEPDGIYWLRVTDAPASSRLLKVIKDSRF